MQSKILTALLNSTPEHYFSPAVSPPHREMARATGIPVLTATVTGGVSGRISRTGGGGEMN